MNAVPTFRMRTARRPAAALAVVALGLTARCPAAAAAAATTAAMAVTIYLTRHGQTWFNLVDRVQGWADSPLTSDGAAIASLLGQGLAEAGVECVAAGSTWTGSPV